MSCAGIGSSSSKQPAPCAIIIASQARWRSPPGRASTSRSAIGSSAQTVIASATAAYYRELQQKIVDDSIQITLVGQREHRIANTKAKGTIRELDGDWILSEAWLEQ